MTLRDIEDTATGPPGGNGPVSVLVVDDSHVFRRGMVRAVQHCDGLELAGEADGGEAALAAIERLAPDLVLLDLRMPDLDGFGVLHRLRHAGPASRGPHVVLVSASLDPGVVAKAHAAGAAACVSKATSRAHICAAALSVAHR